MAERKEGTEGAQPAESALKYEWIEIRATCAKCHVKTYWHVRQSSTGMWREALDRVANQIEESECFVCRNQKQQ